MRGPEPPQVLITPTVDCLLEVIDIPDEDADVDGSAQFLSLDWPTDF